MMTHFVFAGDYYSDYDRLKSLIVEAMKKYEINRVMVTIIDIYRNNLITKEKMDIISNGKEAAKESVNDDFDTFFENLRLGKEPKKRVNTYFLPKLTEAELKLVETKNEDFMATFLNLDFLTDPDIEDVEMQPYESASKFVRGLGRRQTYMIEDPNESINDDLESLFEQLHLGKKPKKIVNIYFLPKWTEDGIELVERKDEYGERKTFTIQN